MNTQKKYQRFSLRTKIFFSFLAISIIPLAIASWVFYLNAYKDSYQKTTNALLTIAKEETDFFDNWFSRQFLDLHQHSSRKINEIFLQKLTQELKVSGKSAKEFVKSFKWAQLKTNYSQDITGFRNLYEYCDILMIDNNGNILFSIAENDDLGSNLKIGDIKETKFAKKCLQVLKTGVTSYSDLEFYKPANNGLYGFLIEIMVDENGNKIGLMAFQISTKQKMRTHLEFYKTKKVYLVGSDFLLRFSSSDHNNIEILNEQYKVNTKIIKKWHQKFVLNQNLNQNQKKVMNYTGRKGRSMIGTAKHIEIAGIPMAVVVEIEEKEALASIVVLRTIVIGTMLVIMICIFFIASRVSQNIVKPVLTLLDASHKLRENILEKDIPITSNDEIGGLTSSFNLLRATFKKREEELEKINLTLERQNKLKTTQTDLIEKMRGEQIISELAENILSYLVLVFKAQIATFFVVENQNLIMVASYAHSKEANRKKVYEFGESLVGQCAYEKRTILYTQIPEDYMVVSSSLGETSPKNILITPFLYEEKVNGVIELGFTSDFTEEQQTLLNFVIESIGIALNSALSRSKMKNLLEELQTQQEELRITNEDLEEKTRNLILQKKDIEQKNQEIQVVRQNIEKKATELELASKYKSEFLANMSHELRTPLNSLLILAHSLAANEEGNLTADQVESALIIESGGKDLLNLINDILDLSKVEAGKLDVFIEEVNIETIVSDIYNQFNSVAKEKNLSFDISIEKELSKTLETDLHRAKQVLKNLLSNAFKFTRIGGVTLKITLPDASVHFHNSKLKHDETIAFCVIDTGIGISRDKKQVIFEAFHQEDGSTNRKYGGTGLGLTISRELAKLINGEIQIQSEEGKGSIFTLFLPQKHPQASTKESLQTLPIKQNPKIIEESKLVLIQEFLPDDRAKIGKGDKSILIIEDDKNFAKTLLDLSRKKGYKVLVAKDGSSGLQIAFKYQPTAILLDMLLPDIEGLQILDNLKYNLKTRHIPIHIISGTEKTTEALQKGAIGFLKKPATAKDIENVFAKIENILKTSLKKILLVEDDENSQKAIIKLIENKGTAITLASTGKESIQKLQNDQFDCVILDLELGDMTGFEILEKAKKGLFNKLPPIIIHTGRELTFEQQKKLSQYSAAIVIKGAEAPERLLDEVSLFLHSLETSLPPEQQKIMRMLHDPGKVMQDKKILLVDDDMRNTFALTRILRKQGLKMVMADNGKVAIDRLESEGDIDLIIMDIMMPVMDGYQAMRKIRKMCKFNNIPIFALTAKAMPEDRAKCLEAGANDYITKPVDLDKLSSMLKIWLFDRK